MPIIHAGTPGANHPEWPEAMATVLSCTYESRVGRAIAFGLPSGKHFHITYNYWAGDELHTADFYSARPIPQGNVFPVRYNPDQPHTSQHTDPASTPRIPLLALGLAGSVVLSLAWLLVLRGCS